MHACDHPHTHIHTYTHTHTQINTHTHKHTHTYKHANTHIQMVLMSVCLCSCVHVHICIKAIYPTRDLQRGEACRADNLLKDDIICVQVILVLFEGTTQLCRSSRLSITQRMKTIIA